MLIIFFARRTEKNSKALFLILINKGVVCTRYNSFFPLFSDFKLEDLKAQKRKIVSDDPVSLIDIMLPT